MIARVNMLYNFNYLNSPQHFETNLHIKLDSMLYPDFSSKLVSKQNYDEKHFKDSWEFFVVVFFAIFEDSGARPKMNKLEQVEKPRLLKCLVPSVRNSYRNPPMSLSPAAL